MIFPKDCLDCASWLAEGSDEGAEGVDNNSLQNTIVAGLSSLTNMASCVESAVRNSSSTNRISILICAKAWKQVPTSGKSTASKSFFLSGPTELRNKWTEESDENLEVRRKARHEELATHAVGSLSGFQQIGKCTGPTAVEAHSLTKTGVVENNSAVDKSVTECEKCDTDAATEERPTNLMPPNIVASSGLLKNGMYVIPDNVAVTCISLLLDGAGYTAHFMETIDASYETLNGRELEQCVSAVHERELQKRELREKATSTSDTGLNGDVSASAAMSNPAEAIVTGFGTNKKKVMRYESMVPSELLGRKITLAVIRLQRTSCSKGFEVTSRKEVSLVIKKPDRNSKDQNFALLCIHLHIFGLTGAAGEVLKQFSSQGLLFAKACVIFRKFSKCKDGSSTRVRQAVVGSFCGGPLRCRFKPSPLCCFFASSGEDSVFVGAGAVQIRCTYTVGARIAPNHTLVRFSSTEDIPEHVRKGLLLPQGRTIEDLLLQPVIWKLSDISRVRIMGPYNKPVGTAIFVHKNPLTELECQVRKRKRTASMDISRAVIISDVQLEQGVASESTPYPYAEWYSLISLKPLVSFHFKNGVVPNSLSGTASLNVTELLWDGERMEDSNENKSSGIVSCSKDVL